MESIINSLKNLFGTYGFKIATIILLTIFFVNLLKKPIVNVAENYAKKYNCDKSIITRYICFLPFVIAFIITFIWELFLVKFNFHLIDYESLITNVFMYGSLAIATFETLKLQFEAYATKKQIEKTKQETKVNKNIIEEIKQIDNEIL